MTYDAILASRGWGRDAFDTVTPRFRAAVRHALFAERAAPVLDELERIVGMSDDGLTVTAKAALGGARVAASNKLAAARALVMPEDDDG